MQVKIGMNKPLLLFLFFVFHTFDVFAQKLSVSSFEVSQGDILARTTTTCRYDTNDKYCALIKVGIALDAVEFECSGGVRDVVKKTGEYWVYLPQNNSKLRVLHKDYTPLEINFYDYGIGKVKSGITYVLTLVKPIQTVSQQKQTLTIRYTPSSATVLVDNKMVRGNNGVAKTTLSVGQHSFVVACDGYESEEGMVKLKASAPSDLQIRLSKEAVAAVTNIAAVSNANGLIQDNVSASSTSSSQSATTSSGFSSTSSVSFGSNEISIPVMTGISIDMVKVEAGTFMMGAETGDETPRHMVKLTKDYYIGKYEVTQRLWQCIMDENPSKFKANNLPVESVSWNDCQRFIQRLNQLTGRHFRLPTEAEWEYAALGGNKSKGYIFSGGNNVDGIGWYSKNCNGTTQPVGMKKPNELGIYDMSGNVYEYCVDQYDKYEADFQVNPIGGGILIARVLRGGAWNKDFDWYLRVKTRSKVSPDTRGIYSGLRLVLSE